MTPRPKKPAYDEELRRAELERDRLADECDELAEMRSGLTADEAREIDAERGL